MPTPMRRRCGVEITSHTSFVLSSSYNTKDFEVKPGEVFEVNLVNLKRLPKFHDALFYATVRQNGDCLIIQIINETATPKDIFAVASLPEARRSGTINTVVIED